MRYAPMAQVIIREPLQIFINYHLNFIHSIQHLRHPMNPKHSNNYQYPQYFYSNLYQEYYYYLIVLVYFQIDKLMFQFENQYSSYLVGHKGFSSLRQEFQIYFYYLKVEIDV